MYRLQLPYHKRIGILGHLTQQAVNCAIDQLLELKLPEVGLDVGR